MNRRYYRSIKLLPGVIAVATLFTLCGCETTPRVKTYSTPAPPPVADWGRALMQKPLPTSVEQWAAECADLRAAIARGRASMRPTGNDSWDGFVASQAPRAAEIDSYLQSRAAQIQCAGS